MILEKYLGVPIVSSRKESSLYNYIVDNVCQKLNGWKSHTLSMAGRVTLAQSCLTSIPGFVMQTTVIPAAICKEVERLTRDFVWGSEPESHRVHLLSWDTICKPKKLGGLGFKNLTMMNQSYMMKLGWALITQ